MTSEPDHFFEPMADHMGAAYLRYSFTKGTQQEVGFLVEQLSLQRGQRVLDVGCGPGRHAYALAQQGIVVHGVDISHRFVELAQQDAPAGATFQRADARELHTVDGFGDYDAVISLCQGAFGLAGVAGLDAAAEVPLLDPDGQILTGMAAALRPGGQVAVSAFSAYFQVQYLEDQDSFNANAGVNHETTMIQSEAGEEAQVDLWTSCFTPRELRLLAAQANLAVDHLWGVTPGKYRCDPPSVKVPEFLLLAHKP